MTAFVISEVEVIDEHIAGEYRVLAAASIAEYGGRYLGRGAEAHVVEGPSTMRRIVIIEFPSLERATEWYASASYAEALKLRAKALDRTLIFVEGLPMKPHSPAEHILGRYNKGSAHLPGVMDDFSYADAPGHGDQVQ